jgi:hypothetical protein
MMVPVTDGTKIIMLSEISQFHKDSFSQGNKTEKKNEKNPRS